MTYNIDFDIGAIFIWLFTVFYLFFKKGLKKTANRIFVCIVLCGLISSIADTVGSYTISYPQRFSCLFMDLWNYMFLSVHNLMSYLFVLYLIYVMGIHYRMKKSSFVLLSLPIIGTFIALFTNPFTHLVYYYDANKIYTHDVLIYLLYFNAFFYMLTGIILIIRFHGALRKSRLYALLIFVVGSTIPIAIQMYYPHILIELFFQSLGILGIMFSIENEDEVINSITHIYNRFAFINDVGTAIKAGNTVRILTIKLPNISYYNTTFGIQCMDGILGEIASWLDSVGEHTHSYDCENGHFALITYRNSEEEFRGMAEKIKKRFEKEWTNRDFQMIFPAQFCIIQVPTEINTIERIMLIVDAPFDNQGKGSQFVASDEFGEYHREIIIEQLIKDAIENHSFQVWYQPIWNREHNKIHSAEALLRLIDDEYGFISPDEFIPIAEKNGTIIEIGEFVFEEVCRLYTEKELDKLGIEYIEVNLSVVQCMNRKLVETFDAILKKYSLDASHINLEITETVAATNQRSLKETVLALRNRGFSFSLDDYGTGYSNFSYMFDMPFSIIKLDKSILWSAMSPKTGQEDRNAMVLLESTLNMMQKMNYRIVVEGVETERQKTLLESFHCDYFQGFYFLKPAPAEPFLEFVCKANV